MVQPITLAHYRARKEAETIIKALGRKPWTYTPAQRAAIAQAQFELNRISLMAEAKQTVQTSPLFKRWRLDSDG
jgi:hypothetical protein